MRRLAASAAILAATVLALLIAHRALRRGINTVADAGSAVPPPASRVALELSHRRLSAFTLAASSTSIVVLARVSRE